ncbi:MAG: hypothetical protein LC130_21800 [Bryobacterales bacterium]|nr:hypothetical protein [Bryobacterales bacterium]MEB2362627.1 hypothetical protein [Bryobacterales bacterium]
MSLALVAVLVVFAVSVLALIWVVRRVSLAGRKQDPNPDWFKAFSVRRYRPMERLLNEGDYVFLESQPGFHPKIARRLRAERRTILRKYLRMLRRDFDRLYAAAKLILVYSESDRPELARELLKQRIVFVAMMTRIELSLAVAPVLPLRPDLRPLVDALESLRLQIQPANLPVPSVA